MISDNFKQLNVSGSLPCYSNIASSSSYSSTETRKIFKWIADVWKDTQGENPVVWSIIEQSLVF